MSDEPIEKRGISRRRVLQSAVSVPAITMMTAEAASVPSSAPTSPDAYPRADANANGVDDPSTWHAYLTDEEMQHPLARYWFRRGFIADDVLNALRRGPMQTADVLEWRHRTRLSDPGDLPVENGYCMLGDGSGYVAVRTHFPDCTADMIDWWFNWAQQEEIIRYKIWYPGAHYSMSQAPTPGYVREPGDKIYWGMSRFPVEDIGVGVTRMRLDFVNPREFGFDGLPDGGTILAVRVGLADGWFKHTDMIHHVRPADGGVEMRSRFWMGRKIEAMAGGAGLLGSALDWPFVKRQVLKPGIARSMAFHCATEYAQLAGFLPELYEQYGP